MTNVYPFDSTIPESSSTAGTVDTAADSIQMVRQQAVEWLAERRISQDTLSALGATCGTRFFGDVQKTLPAIIFKTSNGWKARSFPEKHFTQSKGIKSEFYNLPRVLSANPEEVYIVEGELDLASLVEAGVPIDRVLSVPNGAHEKRQDCEPAEMRGYQYVRDAQAAGLNRVKKFIWCGDCDDPGRALRSDMARLLGIAIFHYVEWQDGYKDANEVLLAEGPDFLIECISNPLPWPVDGIYRISELPEPPTLTLWDPGFPEWERKIRLAPRTLSVVTGQPGHGKTELFQQIWFQIVKAYGITCCMASFETMAKPDIRRQLRTLYSGKLEVLMSDEEKAQADEWINDHYLFLVHPERKPTLGWFLDMAALAVVRHGAKVIQLDPWNRLEASRSKNETETDYIGTCIRELHAFAQDMNCHVQIVAHPSKMGSDRRGSPPQLEDISGSKHWENMPDQGFVIHRPQLFDGIERKTEAHLFHRKARFASLGWPCKLNLDYKLDQGKYISTDYKVGYA